MDLALNNQQRLICHKTHQTMIILSNKGLVLVIKEHQNNCYNGRGFAKGPRDRGSISGRVIPKTQKVLLDTSLLNTQHYKVRFKDKVEQSRETSV